MSLNQIRIPPEHYIHVYDQLNNLERLEVGPQTYICKEFERISTGNEPLPMLVLPPGSFCQITNPVMRDEKGQTIFDNFGQPMVRFETEFRFPEQFPGPFPLYPKEKLSIPVSDLRYGENKEASLQHRRFEEPFRLEERKVEYLPDQNFEAQNLPPKKYVSPPYLVEAPYIQDPKTISFSPIKHISPSYLQGGPYIKDQQQVTYQIPAAPEYVYRRPESPYHLRKPSLIILKKHFIFK